MTDKTGFYAFLSGKNWSVRRGNEKRSKAAGLTRKEAWLKACDLAKAASVSAYLVETDGRVVARQNFG